MLNETKLYRNMIKYHSIIVGWLIKEEKIEKIGDKLVLFDHNKSPYIKEHNGRIIEENDDGSKRIHVDYPDKDYTKISVYKKSSYREIINDGYDVYDLKCNYERYCLTFHIGEILLKHYNILADIWFPDGYKRLKGKEARAYIKWMECKHEHLKKINFNFGFLSDWGYIGLIGFSYNQPQIVENIVRYGIFAYKPIYKQIEWTFELVEEYKDQIVWERLMNDSNLYWEEKMLMKYDKYIPYSVNGREAKYAYDDNSSRRLVAYEKLGFLSNDFLRNHINVLDWRIVLTKCKFIWDVDDLNFFCRNILNMAESSQEYLLYSLEGLLDNLYFKWNDMLLFAFLKINNRFWSRIKGRRHLYESFIQIPNIRDISQPYIDDDMDFWDTVCYKKDFDYDPLTREFNIKNISENLVTWSQEITTKFLLNKRTPDTNYHYYEVITKWDILSRHINIPLTYELAKYLYGLDITIGGTYSLADGISMEDDNRWPSVNGLFLFKNHHFENIAEMEKIIEDDELLETILNIEHECNKDIIKYLVKVFFERISLKQYIEIVNRLKDWDIIKIFY